ncbi:hypothetical protein AwDysgo_15750 [Bacteroidales bacterium]|nr:hypothetical protein AwDysgo_15750 [Bacteroidales bacterium]
MIKGLEKLIDEYCKHIPLNDEIKKKLDQKFRLEFNFNSNHLEGNTLTYGETKLLLIFDQTKAGHEMREFEEMKGHDAALKIIELQASDTSRPLTENFIRELNQTILVREFWKDAVSYEGKNTRRKIKVGQYKEFPNSVIQSNGEIFEYASPQETVILMAELVDWYNLEIEKEESPIRLAALLHYKFIRIHPFDDGNGRVARLLVNYVLLRHNLPLLIIKSDDKKKYLSSLHQADSGDLEPFVDYMAQQLVWSLNIAIKAAKGENIEEENDWEKELTLLKRKASKTKVDQEIVKTNEWVLEILQNQIKPLTNLLENMLSKFDSLFQERILTTDSEPFHRGNSLANLIQDVIDDESYKAEDITIDTKLHNFIDLKTTSEIEFSIKFLFGSVRYSMIHDETICFSKAYNEQLSEEEMNEIAASIAKNLLEQINQLQK